MRIERDVLCHGGQAPPDLIGQIDECLVRPLVKAREGQFAAGFVHLLSEASPQIVQVAIESANLLLFVDSLQRGSGDGAEKSAGAVKNALRKGQ